MMLNDRNAYFTRELPGDRWLDVQPWRLGGVRLVERRGVGQWGIVRSWWYADPVTASVAALLWDGIGVPRWSGRRNG